MTAVEDKKFGFYTCRNRRKDADDIVVTALLKGSKGNYRVPGGEIMVLGLGKILSFPAKFGGSPTSFKADPAGGVVTTSQGSFGVDFSGASGADALLAPAAPAQGGKRTKETQVVTAGKNTFTIMTVGNGPPPEARADGENLLVGNQVVSVGPEGITFSK